MQATKYESPRKDTAGGTSRSVTALHLEERGLDPRPGDGHSNVFSSILTTGFG